MTQAKHSNQSPTNGGIHVIHAFEYADASARNAATFTSADIGKVVRQIDNDTFYIVTGSGSGSSVFDSLSGGGGGGGGSVSDDDPVNVNAAIADPGIDGYASRSDHKHSIDTATAISIGAANTEGTSNSVARADHTHAVTDLSITDQEQGSTLYFDGSNWAQLPPGDDGYVLTSNGVGADPTWEASSGGGGGVSDHGALTGLSDDDHTQYLLVDGTRAMTGNINVGGNNVTNVGTVDGVDVSSHAARHITGAADEIDGDQLDIDFTPSNYTPSTAPAEATNLDHLTAHLSGIDTSLGTIVTDHGGLSGLADDDHTQYLLEDGTRAMSGALNMGTNNITNVGTVDGVDVSTHAARHLPSGADPLTTASAVSIGSANAEGSAESFARSDHTHEVTDLVITSQEQGSVLYFNGSNWSQLEPGTDGYVLTTGGVGNNPTWEQVSGGGGGTSNHGLLSGLGDDDHPQYLLADGTRSMSGDLNLGNNSATNVDYIDFIGNTPLYAEGRVFYDDVEKALALYNDDSDMTHQLGQELIFRVHNGTGGVLPDGYAVYVVNSVEENGVARPSVDYALANTFATSRVIGVVTGDIDEDGYGFVTNRGFVNGIDVSSFSNGDQLYLSETNPGQFRVGPPPSGNYNAQIGYATDISQGRLLVLIEVNLASQTGSASQASTGLVSGGVISVNSGDNTTFDITSGTGEIVDAFTDPGSVDITTVNWDAFVGVTTTNLATADFTWIGIDTNGDVVQIADRDPTHTEARTTIWLGRLGHPTHIALLGVANRPFGAIQPALTGADLARAIGSFNIDGHVYSANGANLQLNRSSGEAFQYGSGFQTDSRDPNTVHLDADTAFTFSYRYRNGSGGWTTQSGQTAIVPGLYDDGSGTLASVSNNRWTIQRIQLSTTGSSLIYYGQTLYTSLSAAVAGITDAVAVDPALSETITRAWVVVRNNATDLTNTSNNRIVNAANGPGSAQASGTVGITDHGGLSGLTDDDHTQYLLVAGTRAMTGNLDMGSQNIVSVGTVDGVDVSAHAARHITGGADEIDGDQLDIDFTPSNYTPSTAPAEATDLDHLTAHLSGIDTTLGTIVTDHGGLAGLADDDHTQYLLVDGTRSMSGSLNMGTNNITNVGTVDGVDVSAHASRHLPGGADALTTASAVSVGAANAEGTNASFARSDHTHAVVDLLITDQEQGSIIYFNGSNWVQLPPGDDGYVLTTSGVGANPAWEEVVGGGGGGVSDHGALTGLTDDDHTQYLLVDGTRSMSGALNMGTNNITNVGTVDGVDISAHASRHITGGADEIDGDQLDIDFTPANYTPSTAPAQVTNVDHLSAHLSGIDTALASVGGGGGGSGDVVGPDTSLTNSIAIFDNADGYLITDTLITIVDGYYIEGVESIYFNDTTIDPPVTGNGEVWFNENLKVNVNGAVANVRAANQDSGIIDNSRSNVVTTWQEACSVTIDNDGIFDLQVSFIWSGSTTTDRCQVRLLKNSTPIGAYGLDRDADGMIVDQIPSVAWAPHTGFAMVTAYTDGTDDVYSLEYRNATGAEYCSIGIPRIIPTRVSDLDAVDSISNLVGRFHADRGNYALLDDAAPLDWWQDYLSTATMLDGTNDGGRLGVGSWSDGSNTVDISGSSEGFQGSIQSTSNDYTICYLFNPSQNTGSFRNLLRSTGSGFEIGCFQSHTGDVLHYEYGHGGTPQSLGVAGTTGEQFLVFVFDYNGDGEVRVYRNGSLLATDDISGQSAQQLNSSSSNQGWYCFPTTSGFSTLCDNKELIVFETALDNASPSDWNALHNYVSDTYGTF